MAELTQAELDGPIVSEREKPQPKVLKESEMALSLDGKYLGEFLNPSYSRDNVTFLYEPESGLDIQIKNRQTVTLSPSDLIALPRYKGYAKVSEVFKEAGAYSDGQMMQRMNAIAVDTETKLHMITAIAELGGVQLGEFVEISHCIGQTASVNPHYSPDDLIATVLGEVDNQIGWRHLPDTGVTKRIQRTGVLSNDEKERRDGIVSYFYLYNSLYGEKNQLAAAEFESTKAALEHFPFVNELLAEYHRQPDGRFGDTLLSACEVLDHKWREEERAWNSRDVTE